MELKKNPTLKDLQEYIKKLCAERGWDKNSYADIFLLFNEEVGELAKAIRNQEQFLLDNKKQKAKKDDLEEEFADVLNYLLDLANYYNIDLEQAFRKKNAHNEKRDWS